MEQLFSLLNKGLIGGRKRANIERSYKEESQEGTMIPQGESSQNDHISER